MNASARPGSPGGDEDGRSNRDEHHRDRREQQRGEQHRGRSKRRPEHETRDLRRSTGSEGGEGRQEETPPQRHTADAASRGEITVSVGPGERREQQG